MNNNEDLKLTELIELANYFFSSISDDNTPDNPGSMLKIESDCDMYNSNDETIKNTNENRRDDNMKKDFDYGKLYGKFMACKCGQKDDDDNVSIYGCKCDNDCKCDNKCGCSWSDKCDCGNDCKCDDDCKCGNDWSYLWDDDNCKCGDDCKCGDNNKCDDECKSLWSRKSFKCSSDVFEPVCCNAICKVPRMDIVKMVAEGQGTIADADLDVEEPEVPDAGGEAGELLSAAELAKLCKCGKNCKCGNGGTGGEGEEAADAELAFKFFIGKKHSKYVGSMCLVNFDEGIFLTSEKLECFHNPDHTKFVAIFHFTEADGRSREITVYGTTQICNILPTLFIFSAPHCGEEDALMMGGSVTTGTITIAKKCDNDNDDNGMMM